MGFRLSRLEPGGYVDTHLHSFEESIFIVDGSMVIDLPEGAFLLQTGDYGLIPVGVPHGFRNSSEKVAQWAEMKAPLPRSRFDFDTYFPKALGFPQTAREPISRTDRCARSSQPSLWTHRRSVDGSR